MLGIAEEEQEGLWDLGNNWVGTELDMSSDCPSEARKRRA